MPISQNPFHTAPFKGLSIGGKNNLFRNNSELTFAKRTT